ncbi:hypothetical protein TPHA_0C01900 [Tetrapisispora phaffii CBS 4417]|uniref:Uncharacterized protein n=1 Tax=Tetrapisispora phaffii (strain ATCC 24235 / CBS 4417 / NBRC 1672 / NRRL Y-8282 / UCD 70-5) TaxID=1071381 RepID=G8BRG9_TETPH|nr:hypothetical protein TPHA_0C01900 [Tetrapisispora phaffii CBS 4417]CCE62345.1 hypothetical protein TPHA_0C01900 [Tetrapisispora phaffii CBS 4417]
MPVKKRIRESESAKVTALFKKKRTQLNENDNEDVQNIWRKLNNISTKYEDSGKNIKNSLLFVTFTQSYSDNDISNCITALHQYIDESKLQFIIHCKHKFVILKTFNILDCCLTLTILFAFKNKRWVSKNTNNYFSISKELDIRGSFYLSERTKLVEEENNNIIMNKIQKSTYSCIQHFDEFHITEGKNILKFMDTLSKFFISLKFSKNNSIIKAFTRSYTNFVTSLDTHMTEMALDPFMLYDLEHIISQNKPLIEESKNHIANYAKELTQYTKGIVLTENGSGNSTRNTNSSESTIDVEKYNNEEHTTRNPKQTLIRSTFMTQEQIKDHCVASVKAGMDTIKEKSPYDIMKVYLKCPKQNYIDLIYQNLNDLTTKSNCNIIVLHLNNLHESEDWFKTLDISKYTNFTQVPHPSTVRIVSIGGVGEHILKAFQMILDILNT